MNQQQEQNTNQCNQNMDSNSCEPGCLHNNKNNNSITSINDEFLDDTINGIDRLLSYNKKWSAEIKQKNPNFFIELAKNQSPEYLWIGCSDSRVPVEKLVGLGPGEVFVHRNIANQVIHTDLNCLSVIQYAVDVLKVKHIIVCGHYQCGGVKAAIDNPKIGLINNWINHIRDIYNRYKKQLHELEDQDLMFDKLVELNLVQQVYNIGNSTVLQNAWERGQEITIHGWIYGLKDGRVKELDYAANSKQVFEEIHDKVTAKLLNQMSDYVIRRKTLEDFSCVEEVKQQNNQQPTTTLKCQ